MGVMDDETVYDTGFPLSTASCGSVAMYTKPGQGDPSLRVLRSIGVGGVRLDVNAVPLLETLSSPLLVAGRADGWKELVSVQSRGSAGFRGGWGSISLTSSLANLGERLLNWSPPVHPHGLLPRKLVRLLVLVTLEPSGVVGGRQQHSQAGTEAKDAGHALLCIDDQPH